MNEARYMEVISGDEKLVGEKIGTISVEVYKSLASPNVFYYIQPDTSKLLPVVDVLDDVLTGHSIHL